MTRKILLSLLFMQMLAITIQGQIYRYTVDIQALESHRIYNYFHDQEENIYSLSCNNDSLWVTKLNLSGNTLWQKNIGSIGNDNDGDCSIYGFKASLVFNQESSEVVVFLKRNINFWSNTTKEIARLSKDGDVLSFIDIPLEIPNSSTVYLVGSKGTKDYYLKTHVTYYGIEGTEGSFLVDTVNFSIDLYSFDNVTSNIDTLYSDEFIPDDVGWDTVDGSYPAIFLTYPHNSTESFFDINITYYYNYYDRPHQVFRFDWEGNLLISHITPNDWSTKASNRLTNDGRYYLDYIDFRNKQNHNGSFINLNDSLLLFEDLLINTNTNEVLDTMFPAATFRYEIDGKGIGYSLYTSKLAIIQLDELSAIKNTIYYDENGNCDNNSSIIRAKEYQITSGDYSYNVILGLDLDHIYLRPGNYTISPKLDQPSLFVVDPPEQSISVIDSVEYTLQDFCILNSELEDCQLNISLIPLNVARPGFLTKYKCIIENKGNLKVTGNLQISYPDSILKFDSTTDAWTESQGVLELELNELHPFDQFESELNFLLNSPQDTPPINDGDVIQLKLIAETLSTNGEKADNFTLNQTVLNSFDPNDKFCLQGDQIHIDNKSDYLYYKIRFENNGSASAINVKVVDQIDVSLYDISQLRLTYATHPVQLSVFKNHLTFDFQNINLSHIEGENQGFVVFGIKLKNEVKPQDVLRNRAYIFFDFNLGIKTQIVNTIICEDEIIYDGIDNDCDPTTLDDDLDEDGFGIEEDCDDLNPEINPSAEEIADNGIDEDCDGEDLIIASTDDSFQIDIRLYPIPADQILYIETEKMPSNIEVFDMNGRLLFTETKMEISVGGLVPGLYLLKVNFPNGKIGIKKFTIF